MAISFVNMAQGSTNYGTSYSISKPTNTADNDLLIAIVGGTRSGSAPAGWSEFGSANSTSTSLGYVYVYYKIASGEPSSYTFNLSSSYLACGVILAYRGINTSTPVDLTDKDVTAVTGGGTNYNSTSVTATADQWGLTFATAYEYGSSSTRTWTEGSGTERCDFSIANTGSPDNTNLEATDSNALLSAGAFTRTQTRSATSNMGVKGTILINAAQTASPISPLNATATIASDTGAFTKPVDAGACAVTASITASGLIIPRSFSTGVYCAYNSALSSGTTMATGLSYNAGAKVAIQLAIPAAGQVRIVEWGASMDSADPIGQVRGLFELALCDTASTMTYAHDATTVRCLQTGAGGSRLRMAVDGTGYGNDAITSNTTYEALDRAYLSPRKQFVRKWDQGSYLLINGTGVEQFLQLRVNMGVTVNAICYLIWEEDT